MNDRDLEKWMSLKENFVGNEFQWIKPPKPELLAKVVKCIDVTPLGGIFFAQFADGSQIETSKLGHNLMMLGGGTKPMNRAEVASISDNSYLNAPVPDKSKTKEVIVKNLGQKAGEEYEQEQHDKINRPLKSQPGNPIKKKQSISEPAPAVSANLFGSFATEETNLPIKVAVKIPPRSLLKMMYNSATDKNEFLMNLSLYVNQQINKDVVMESLKGIFEPKKKRATTKKEESVGGSHVELTEIINEKKD